MKVREKRANPRASLYTMGPQRGACRHAPFAPCFVADCSYAFTDYYSWAGVPDPSRNSPDPYTGTLIECGREVSLDRLRIADAVIYFDYPNYQPSTGSHVAVVVGLGPDPLTVSFGWQGEPALVRVSQDGRAHKFFTYDTRTRRVHYPPGYKSATKRVQS